MRSTTRFILLFIIALAVSISAAAQNRERLNGWCEDGNQVVTTDSRPSTTKVQRSYPSCTVTVYLSGTVTPATIYSDYAGTPLANPFTAASTGQWTFVASAGRYDVRFSGGGITTPFTRSGAWVSGIGGAGVATPAQITSNQNNYPADSLSGTFYRLSTDASRNITGLALITQGNGDFHWLWNVGSQPIVLTNQDGASAAANRFLNSNGGNITLSPDDVAFTFYDSVTGRNRTVELSGLLDPGTNGYLVRTGINTIVSRTFQSASANQIVLTNADGTGGNTVIGTAQDIGTVSSPTFANLTLSSGGTLTVTGAGTITVGNSGVWSTGTSSTFTLGSGSAIQTGTGAGNTLLLRAFDTDTGPAYVTFVTFAAGTTPTMVVNQTFQVNSTITGNANNVTLNLNAATAAADLTLGSTPGTIRQIQASSVGTRDLIWRATPDSSAGYGINETATGAGHIVRTTGNTNPVIFQVNSVEQGRFATGSNLFVGAGPATASPAAATINGPGGTGTNNVGGVLSIAAGLGTGNAAPPLPGVRYVKSTGTGTTQQTLTSTSFPFATSMLSQYADSAAVANTTTETTIVATSIAGTKTLPGGASIVGTVIHIQCGGTFGTTGTPQLNWRVKYGATAIASLNPTLPTVTGSRWIYDAWVQTRAVGTSGSVAAQTTVTWSTTGGGGATGINHAFAGGVQTINIDNDQVVDVTVQWSAASASNTVNSQWCDFTRVQ